MGGIRMPRVLLGGAVAGSIIFVLEGLAGELYMADMRAALAAHDLAIEMSRGTWVLSFLTSVILGCVAIWFYAACRPRFGPGPKTAALVALVLWLGGYLLSLIGYHLLGLFPVRLLALWGVAGLAEMMLGTIAGAWLYRE